MSFCCLIITMLFPAGKSALHWAAAVNNVEATLLLLKNGANRDMQDNKVQAGLWAEGAGIAAPRGLRPSLSSRSSSWNRFRQRWKWPWGELGPESWREGSWVSSGQSEDRALCLLSSQSEAGCPVKGCGVSFSALCFLDTSLFPVPCSVHAHFFFYYFHCFSCCSYFCSWTPWYFPVCFSFSKFHAMLPSLVHPIFSHVFPLFLYFSSYLCLLFLLSFTCPYLTKFLLTSGSSPPAFLISNSFSS